MTRSMSSSLPPPELDGLVERIWFFEQAGGGGLERRLPDGGLEIVLHLEGPGTHGASGTEPTFLVAGPRARAEILDGSPGRLAGAHCRPGSARALFGIPASELRGRDLDLGDLWGPWAAELAERVAGAPTPEGRLQVLAEGLVARPVGPVAPSRAVEMALARLEADPVGTRIAGLVELAGVSWRRFIRAFEEEVGLAPKVFQRVRRLQRVLGELRRAGVGGAAAAALDAGYADQAHLLREFRALADLTPGAYQRAAPALQNHVPLA